MITDELSLIGTCLSSPEICLSKVVEKDVKPEMLENIFCQKCLRIMLHKFNMGENVSLPSVHNALVDEGYDQEKAKDRLGEAAASSGFISDVDEYIKAVIRSYKSTQIINFLKEADFTVSGIERYLPQMVLLSENLMQNKNNYAVHANELVKEFKNDRFTDKRVDTSIKTNIPFIDDSLIGLERGDITVIGARPGVGKSALVTQIIGNVAETMKVGYFNYEMQRDQIYDRFLSRYMKVGLTRIRKALQFVSDEKQRFDKGNEKIENLNFDIINTNPDVNGIRNMCKYAKYDLVVIDYLQLIPVEKSGRSKDEEIGEISRKLKLMASELKLHIILVSQLNRGSEYQMDKEPGMKDLRYSGNIEQDASNIIMLWNLSKENYRYKGFVVCKCRQNAPGDRKVLAFNKHDDFTFEQEKSIPIDHFNKSNEPRRSRDPDYRME